MDRDNKLGFHAVRGGNRTQPFDVARYVPERGLYRQIAAWEEPNVPLMVVGNINSLSEVDKFLGVTPRYKI